MSFRGHSAFIGGQWLLKPESSFLHSPGGGSEMEGWTLPKKPWA
jgi:hypothetical protein